jgi:hypothetical protein
MCPAAIRVVPPEIIDARRELWRYQSDKPNKVPPADSPNRPALARLWWVCYQAAKRRPKLRTFTYCGMRFGVVFVGHRMGVMDLQRRALMVLAPGSQYALATILNQQGVSRG